MKKIVILLLAVLLLTGCTQTSAETEEPMGEKAFGEFTLTFITIGKGDAFLLTTPDNSHYLVDTGKAEDYVQIARTLRLKGIDHLRGIFLSHGHKDHAGCLAPLLKAFPTEEVFISGRDNVSYREIDPCTIAEENGARLTELLGGETLDLGGVTAEVWIPQLVDRGNENNNSMILQLVHGDNRFLLMGDAELSEEAALMASGVPIQARVLKLGHHGEADATSSLFLKSVSPEIALITGNAEENPESVNESVSGYLEERQIEVYYSEGDPLDIHSDGRNLILERVQDRSLPQTLSLSFTNVDRAAGAVTIRNDAEKSAQLGGCALISQRGDEIFLFPEGTQLAPGRELTIVCRDSLIKGELIWNEDSVWKKHRDTALLYDSNMNLLDIDEAAD